VTRKDMGVDLRVAMDAIVNKRPHRGAHGAIELFITVGALLLACAMLCRCGGAPFTTADLALSRSDAESPQAQADADANGDASASDAVDAHGGVEAATDAGGDVDPRSGDGSAQADSSSSQDAATLYTHYNGVGQTWEDEVPLGTYDLAEATSACVAFTGDASRCGESFCGPAGTRNIVCASGVTWCWSFLTVDGAVAGHVYNDDAGYRCPGASDPSWQ
jgi:hypothetical protein